MSDAGRHGPDRAASLGQVLLFAAASFVGAFLLFVVQPMMGRAVLPFLGGSPAVWTTSLFFFQAGLLGGYLYAHAGMRFLGPRRLAPVHLVLLVVSVLTLPAVVPSGWTPPTEGSPVPWLLALLTVSVGAPFFLLSTTAPVVQRWYAATDPTGRRDPYFLYAASNLGSLGALLAYPFVVEPLLGLEEQTRSWSVGFGVWIVLVAGCAAWVLLRGRRESGSGSERSDDVPHERPEHRAPQGGTRPGPGPGAGEADEEEGTEESRPSDGGRGDFSAPNDPRGPATTRLRWVLLAFAPSSLLMGVTTHLSTDVAAAPLLWVVPLALYLLTFAIAFSRKPVLSHDFAVRWQPLVVIPLVVALFWGVGIPDVSEMLLHLMGFFLTALVCHGELVRLRPPARKLTEFYLWIATGGMLGGFFNAVLAPVVFDRALEYPLVLVGALLLRPGKRFAHEGRSALVRDVGLPLAVGALVLVVLWVEPRYLTGTMGRIAALALMGSAAVACLLMAGRPARLTLAAGTLLLVGWVNPGSETSTVLTERSFYGIHRVVRSDDGRYTVLYHGTTIHGAQSRNPARRLEPLTYYRLGGPLHQALTRYRAGDEESGTEAAASRRSIGVLGLGAGAMACLGSSDERWTFYEIDREVIDIATDPDHFTYLRDCPPEVDFVVGDARRSLRTGEDRRFDVLIADAFSSDAIPVHLMTTEAVDLYFERLEPDGLLAFHVSNRHMLLEPVLAAIAEELGLVAAAQAEQVADELDERMIYDSHWVVMAREREHLRGLLDDQRWRPAASSPSISAWTDDYSSVAEVMVWTAPGEG